jgi:hypothetical protein
MFHHHKVPLFAIQSIFYSFNVLAHSCASLPLRCKCSAYHGLSVTITTFVASQAWPCKNIDLAKFIQSILIILSIHYQLYIYIYINFYTFTKKFNLTIKLTKYKMDLLNKLLFISSQNTYVKNST